MMRWFVYLVSENVVLCADKSNHEPLYPTRGLNIRGNNSSEHIFSLKCRLIFKRVLAHRE